MSSKSAFTEYAKSSNINWGDALTEAEDSETNISDLEIFLKEQFQEILSGSLAPLEDELATVRCQLDDLQKRFTQVVEMLTSVIANQQSVGKAVGYDWGIKDKPALVDGLNWIVDKIREAGSNSILPSQLGLIWNNEFKNTPAPWVSEKKPDGKKIGIKAVVTKYGNGNLFVEDTDHVKAKILLNP